MNKQGRLILGVAAMVAANCKNNESDGSSCLSAEVESQKVNRVENSIPTIIDELKATGAILESKDTLRVSPTAASALAKRLQADQDLVMNLQSIHDNGDLSVKITDTKLSGRVLTFPKIEDEVGRPITEINPVDLVAAPITIRRLSAVPIDLQKLIDEIDQS